MNCIYDRGNKCELLRNKNVNCITHKIPCSYYREYIDSNINIPEKLKAEQKAMNKRRYNEMLESSITICGHGGGTPSKKNLKVYCEQRYQQKAPNGKHKGLIAVRRLKALDNKHRKEFRAKYNTILGRNIYSQDLRNYVYTKYPKTGKYYSDCSSSGMATFRNIGYTNVPMLNTAGIYQSPLFEDVKVKIKNGHIQNPEVLKVGDCLLFVGNDPSRPKQIGHVEYIYKMPKETKTKDTHKGIAVAKPTLKKGSAGYEVKVLQGNLNDADVSKTKLKVDGVFGANTEAVLKVFQRKHKLVPDGIYGSKSAEAMEKAL